MHKFITIFYIILFFFCPLEAHAKPAKEKPPILSAINLIDREGLSQTINSPQKLRDYQKIDFLSPQPYQKVMQIYKRGKNGKVSALLTSYYPNGQLKQLLNVVENRAKGTYREWFQSGALRLEATLIGGIADLTPAAEKSWLFDEVASAWSETGKLEAKILYKKGELQGLSTYYHPNGAVAKQVPYQKGILHGSLQLFSEEGTLIQSTSYDNGLLHGEAFSYWPNLKAASKELYSQGNLMEGSYWKEGGALLSTVEGGFGSRHLFLKEGSYQVEEVRSGKIEGAVALYSSTGILLQSYRMKEGKKEGEERFYYPFKKGEKEQLTKLSLNWHKGKIQGVTSTWYENGVLESERELSDNKLNGLSRAWYPDGNLMLIEEYADNLLQKGDYQKKGESLPFSQVLKGKGVCTLFDAEGRLIRKIHYDEGHPVVQ